MTDRVIVYAGSGVQDTDILQLQNYGRQALSYLNAAVLGSVGIITGFVPVAVSGMSVTLGQGAIHCGYLPEDATALGSQPASFTQITPVGIKLTNTDVGPFFAAPQNGQSANHIICGRYVSVDTDNAVLYYQNAANPNQIFRGVGNSGAAQPTRRTDGVELITVFGAAAPTGQQVTPDVPNGYIPLYVVTTTFGQSVLNAGNIVRHPDALFLPLNLYQVALDVNAAIQSAGLAPDPLNRDLLAIAIGIIGTRQIRFSANGNFVVPIGTHRVRAQIWGGGGGGGNGANGGGGGGSAGGYQDTWFDVVPGETLAIEVAPGGTYPGGPGVIAPGPSRVLRGGAVLAGALSGNAGSSGPSGAGDTAFGTAIGGGGFGESGSNGLGVASFSYGGQGGSAFGYKGGQAQIVGPSGTANGNGGQTGSGGSGGAGFGNGGVGGGGAVLLTY